MFRFYCTKCKRVKRVQQVPNIISNVRSLEPEKRLGECNFHLGILQLKIGRERFRDDNLDTKDGKLTYHSKFRYRHARNQSMPKVNTPAKTGKGKR